MATHHKREPDTSPTPQPHLTVARPTVVKLTVDAPTLQPQLTERRPTLQPTLEVNFTEREATLQLQLTEEKPTHQPHHTVVILTVDVLTEVRLTLQATEREVTPQPQLTEVKLTVDVLTEETPTEVNHTDTKHDVQIDYFAVLFQDNQTSRKNFKIDYF